MKKDKSVIYGPFIGEFLWELYHFVPYFIYQKKKNHKLKHIVITREDRFDLYGVYADVLCPLRIQSDDELIKKKFTIEGLPSEHFEKIKQSYIEHLKYKYDITDVVCANVNGWYNDIKWQFPRDETEYDFIARKENRKLVNDCVKENDKIIFNETKKFFSGYRNIRTEDLEEFVKRNKNLSFYGLSIEFLKKSRFYIGEFNSHICRLAMLLGIPVIVEKVELVEHQLKLINPLDTRVIEEEYEKGIKVYENYIRFKKNRSRK